MSQHGKSVTILMADDDALDPRMVQRALQKSRLANDLICVEDGEELTDYLCHRGEYTNPNGAPGRGLLLLRPEHAPQERPGSPGGDPG